MADYDDYDDDDPLAQITDRPFRLHVEGTCLVFPWQEDFRSRADQLTLDATALGLHAFRQYLRDDVDPDTIPGNRRWTVRRVSGDDVFRYIAARPGVAFAQMVEDLYAEPPWTARERRNATGKLRTALYRLRGDRRVVKRFDGAGIERWQVADVATGLRTTAAGPTAQPPDEHLLQPVPLLAEQLEAGAALLRRVGFFSDQAVKRDPNLYVDLALAVWQAMTRSPPSKET